MPLGRYEGLMGLPMSTMGQKQTLRGIRSMSESGHWMRGGMSALRQSRPVSLLLVGLLRAPC